MIYSYTHLIYLTIYTIYLSIYLSIYLQGSKAAKTAAAAALDQSMSNLSVGGAELKADDKDTGATAAAGARGGAAKAPAKWSKEEDYF